MFSRAVSAQAPAVDEQGSGVFLTILWKKTMSKIPWNVDTLLVVGTDLSGKNHVANLIAENLTAAGYKVEKREGKFSAAASVATTSEDKSRFELFREWLFLRTFPLHHWLIPYVVTFLIKRDVRNFVKKDDGVLLVISHTALRVLAFYLAHVYEREADIRMPGHLERALRELSRIEAKVVVLDIEHHVREQRAARRMAKDKIDYFDRYMAENPLLSERVEDYLIWLSRVYFGATKIVNNDLTDEEILARVQQACG